MVGQKLELVSFLNYAAYIQALGNITNITLNLVMAVLKSVIFGVIAAIDQNKLIRTELPSLCFLLSYVLRPALNHYESTDNTKLNFFFLSFLDSEK